MLGDCSLTSRIQLSVRCVDDGVNVNVKCAAASSLLCESIVGAHTTDWLAGWRGSGLWAQAAAAARETLECLVLPLLIGFCYYIQCLLG